MAANTWLHPGNTANNSSHKEFLQETLEQALVDINIGLLRVDSGFYTKETLRAI